MTKEASERLRNWTALVMTIAGVLVAVVMAWASLRADVDANAAAILTMREQAQEDCREDRLFREAVINRLTTLERKQDVVLDRLENNNAHGGP